MKKTLLITSLALATFFVGCTSNDGMNITPEKPGGPYIAEPLKANNTETHFRAVGSGKSYDRNTARKAAVHAARTALAEKIRTALTSEAENRLKRTETVAAQDGEHSVHETEARVFVSVSKSFTSEMLRNLNEYGTPVYEKVGDQIEFTIGMEMSRADVAEEIYNAAKKDKSAKIPAERNSALQREAAELAKTAN